MCFEDIDKEKIQAYINIPIEGNGPVKKILYGCACMLFLAALPVFIMGAAKGDMTTIVITFLATLVISALPLLLKGNIAGNKEKVILVFGVQNAYLTFLCTFATYKVISSVIDVSSWQLAIGFLFDIVLCLYFNKVVLKKIREGYYCQKIMKKNSIIAPALGSGLAILIGKIISPYVSQSAAIIFICFSYISLSIIFAQRTHNLLKYYLIKTFNLKVESEWD